MDRAEAVWIAGGNQWDYLGGWPASFQSRLATMEGDGLAVGGTSAGAMVMGEAAFNARHGTVTSADALADPLRPEVSVGYPPFSQPELQGILVDTHFTERGREGRLLAFLARFLDEKGYAAVTGIGLDEEVAVILEDGSYTVSTAGDGGLWAYRVEGPATLRAGEPLALYGIRRIRLENGDTGVWPLDFEAASTQALQVENGVVGPGS
jgi:cyanophycinase-like exopeptidase